MSKTSSKKTYGAEKERRRKMCDIESATRIGKARQAKTPRRCPVEGCKDAPRYYSRYCRKHAEKLRFGGHPTLAVNTKTRADYAACLKIGRGLREALTGDNDMDRRAWMRVEDGLRRIGRDVTLKHGIPTLARREKAWRNEYKAKCVISARLEAIDPEEMLAAFLGAAAVIIEHNDVMVNARQFELFIHKAGARAATRYMKTAAYDGEGGKVYKWEPSAGCVTQIGKLISKEIAKEFGGRWWKDAEVKLVTRHHWAAA